MNGKLAKILDSRFSKFNSSISSVSPSQTIVNSLQYKFDADFNNSPTKQIIGEEQTFGTLVFTNIDVRITSVISDKSTGEKLSEDFKKLIFKDISTSKSNGQRYSFDNSIWITINTDNLSQVTKSSIVRRCNNSLKWKNVNNVTKIEPCFIESRATNNELNVDKYMSTPESTLIVSTQGNDISRTIVLNQRFLFGNPSQAYKITAIQNHLNQDTYDDNSVPIIKFTMELDSVNNKDDLVNRIADNSHLYPNNVTSTDW